MRRRVVRVAPGPRGQLVAGETRAVRVVREPAVFGIAGVEAEDIGQARLAGGDQLRFRHQQWHLVGAGGIEALTAIQRIGASTRSTQLLQANGDPGAALGGERLEVAPELIEAGRGQHRRDRGHGGGCRYRVSELARLAGQRGDRHPCRTGAGIGGTADQHRKTNHQQIEHQAHRRTPIERAADALGRDRLAASIVDNRGNKKQRAARGAAHARSHAYSRCSQSEQQRVGFPRNWPHRSLNIAERSMEAHSQARRYHRSPAARR